MQPIKIWCDYLLLPFPLKFHLKYAIILLVTSSVVYVFVMTSQFQFHLSCRPVAQTTTSENNHIIVPRVPFGISGTALAASLLRDGWSVRL